jgi:site-specific DNA-methyltransferase (adenine-specific)
MIKLIQGDCLEKMKDIPDGSIDLVLCDLPYGTTRLKWDCPIDLTAMFCLYDTLIKPKGAIVLFGNQPFTSKLVMTRPTLYKYSWMWVKPFPTGFLNANYRPMLSFEDILVFSKSGAGAGSKNNNMNYYPQGLIEINKKKKNKKGTRGQHIHDTVNCGKQNVLNSEKEYQQKFTGYPNNILEYDRDKPQLHPTQKPLLLCEYLIKTYTKEGDTVLDNCMGSGTTGVACKKLNRNFIGIELDQEYFKIAEKRIYETKV